MSSRMVLDGPGCNGRTTNQQRIVLVSYPQDLSREGGREWMGLGICRGTARLSFSGPLRFSIASLKSAGSVCGRRETLLVSEKLRSFRFDMTRLGNPRPGSKWPRTHSELLVDIDLWTELRATAATVIGTTITGQLAAIFGHRMASQQHRQSWWLGRNFLSIMVVLHLLYLSYDVPGRRASPRNDNSSAMTAFAHSRPDVQYTRRRLIRLPSFANSPAAPANSNASSSALRYVSPILFLAFAVPGNSDAPTSQIRPHARPRRCAAATSGAGAIHLSPREIRSYIIESRRLRESRTPFSRASPISSIRCSWTEKASGALAMDSPRARDLQSGQALDALFNLNSLLSPSTINPPPTDPPSISTLHSVFCDERFDTPYNISSPSSTFLLSSSATKMTPSAKSILDIPYTSSFPVSTYLPSSGQFTQVLDMMRLNPTITYSPADVLQIRGLIPAIRGEIARYDNELASRGRFSEVVVADRATLQNFLDRCRSAITSPIRKLPPEVLSHIFLFYHNVEESYDSNFDEDGDQAVVTALRRLAGGDLRNIAQVCYLWHAVVDSTPALWTSLAIDMRSWETEGEAGEPLKSLVQAYMLLDKALQRGGILPLDIEVVAPRCHPLVLLALARFSRRWRSATLHVDSAMAVHLEKVQHDLPLLEQLRLRLINEDTPDAPENIAKYFSDAPLLKVLDYCGPIDALQHLPMEQLSRFKCSMLVPADILPLTSLLPRLYNSVVHAHLDLDAFAEDDGPLGLSLVKSSLQELSITATAPSGSGMGHLSQRVLGEILDALELPSLARLYLLCAFAEGKPLLWPHTQGLAFLQRCKYQGNSLLDTLHLHDVVITEEELVECLGELQTLRDLYVTDHPAVEALPNSSPHVLITDTLLQRLSPDSDDMDNSLVPMLASVQFKTIGEFSDQVLLEFIEKRVGAVAHWDLEDEPFDCCVSWIPGYARGLGQQQAAAIEGMEQNGELEFTMCEDDLD
ncbi:hypothetical protein R3P38DRAFT_3342096 [Favolaschia claudopus]|uniref:F-box domain-containing protein n=1 Tax=Favolaschia claudopus TaxID=2862362 RepID=A0AAW0E338_9AGAR